MHSENSIKAQVSSKKGYDTIAAVATNKNAIGNALGKGFAITLDFEVFKHLEHFCEIKETLNARFELNSFKKVFFCSKGTTVTYKISNIFLEPDAIFDVKLHNNNKWVVCWKNIDLTYQSNINSLPATTQKRH